MTHVHVEHPVFRVGPHHGKVAVGDDILDADRKVGRIERHENVDILVEAGTGLPEVPLIGRRRISIGKIPGHRMRAIIDQSFRRQGRPIVGVENGAAQETGRTTANSSFRHCSAETWKPSHPPPCSMYFSNADR